MKRYIAGLAPFVFAAGAHAADLPANAATDAPQPGRDYISVQIASGDAQALRTLYARHAGLPYLRIERRGNLHVLRAGFWPSARAARLAIAGSGLDNPMIRDAAFKPEEIVLDNWGSAAARPANAPIASATPIIPQAESAPPAPLAPPVPAMPAPVAPAAPIPVAPAAPSTPGSPLSPSSGTGPLATGGRNDEDGSYLQPVAFVTHGYAPSNPPDDAGEARPRLQFSGGLMLAAFSERMPAPVTTVPPPPTLMPAPKPTTPALPADVAPANGQEEMRPFNQADYALAFDIFVGAGDLKRGFRVAEKAVQSVPEDNDWRLKLARVAEWIQRPQVAWTQREYLFRHGDRSDETITAILRLAPVAPNMDTVLAVWEMKADRAPLTEAQWNDLQAMFDAASKPREGSQYFEAQYRRRKIPSLLARAAQLADNAGDDERAYKLYVERLDLKPFSPDLALRAVVFLLRHDRNREAYNLLNAHRSEVPPEATDYWRMLAQTSWELAELGTAEEAYRKYLTSKEATVADWSRLIALVRQRHPGEAAQLSMEVYRRYKNLDYLILALTIRTDANDIGSQGRILASLSEAERLAAEKDNRFLVLRAQYYQLSGKTDLAWNDFRVALSRAGTDTDVTVPALWFLIDTRRVPELSSMLAQLAPQAANDSAYWLAYASAYHALDRYREAIYWYRKEIERRPDDSLMLLNYADCLDRYQLTGMADRVRQHVWVQLRGQQADLVQGELKAPFDQNPELLAFVRLALLNQPGDPALAIVRDVAAKLRGLPPVRADDRETRTLILSWAVASEQFQNARSWMWLRYARSEAARMAVADARGPRQADVAADGAGSGFVQAGMQSVPDPRGTPPMWAQAQTALQLNDTPTMDRLLMRQADAMPIYNRYDSAYALEHWQQALDLAFRGMEKNPVDEELHDRFRQHAPLHTSYMQATFTKDAYGDLDSRSQQFEARWQAWRKLQVKVGFSRAQQSSGNQDYGPFTPATDKLSSIGIRYLGGEEANTEASVYRRNEATSLTGAQINQTYRLNARLALDGTAEYRGNATESIPLRIAGYTNNARVGVTYTISKREYIRVSGQLDRYYTQFGDYLGRASRMDIDAGYMIRTEYPDLRVRVFAARQLMTRDGSVSDATISRLPPSIQAAISDGSSTALQYFLPDSSTTVGWCVGEGENLAGGNLQEIYTRAWRPFFEACQQHNTLNGPGYIGQLGVAGSVIGPDHLSFRYELSRGGTGVGSLARTLALRYRYYF